MTKKLIALLLVAAMMLVAFAACDKDEPAPGPGPGGNDTQNAGGDGTQAPGGNDTQAPVDTKAPEVSYQPDLECPYNGYIGIGIEAGKAYFDDIRVTDQGAKMQLIDTDFEDTAAFPEFHALGSTDAVTATQVDCPVQVLGGKDITNHAIEISTPSTLMSGDRIWNYYQYRVKVMPADNDTLINIYFAVQDENNYYVLTLGEDGNTKATCYKVTDGNKENAQFTIFNTVSLEKYTPISITLKRDFAEIYIDGECKLEIGNSALVNDYYDYTGTQEPASVVQGGLGAPGENLEYLPVDPENVIHDGKGTWGSALTTVATMVFDKSYNTFYDCDMNGESPNEAEGELPGLPGDGTHATGYVGAYFEEAVDIAFVRYAPRSDYPDRMRDGTFEVSNDGVSWTPIYTIVEAPAAGTFTSFKAEIEGPVNYIRYVGPSGGYCNIAEMEIWVNK